MLSEKINFQTSARVKDHKSALSIFLRTLIAYFNCEKEEKIEHSQVATGWGMHPMVQPLPPQVNRVCKVDINDNARGEDGDKSSVACRRRW